MDFKYPQFIVYPAYTFLTDGRREPQHQFTIFFADYWLECKSKKIKLLVTGFEWGLFLLVPATINDSRLAPVYFQFAGFEPFFYRLQQAECFFYMVAMHHYIISIPFINNFRVPFLYPFIKHHI